MLYNARDRYVPSEESYPHLHPVIALSRPSSPYSTPPPSPAFSPHHKSRWHRKTTSMHICPFNIPSCKGCGSTSDKLLTGDSGSAFGDGADQLSPSSALSSSDDHEEDDDFPVTDSAPSPSVASTSLMSAKTNRVQLKHTFLRLYFPRGTTHGETDFQHTKLLCTEILDAKGPTMLAAVDVIYLVQIGTSHNDFRLIHEAQTRYHAAVANLKLDLVRPNALYDDDLLGTIYLLGLAEIYRPLSQRGRPGSNFLTHHHGLRDMLIERGPKSEYSKFAQLVVYNFRHLVAIVGCSERKRVPFAGQEWRDCAALTDGLMAALTEYLIDTPGVLEKADVAMRRPKKDLREMFDVLLELARLERRCQSWLVAWYSSFPDLPYRQEDLHTFQHFRGHCTGTARNVFPKAASFPTFGIGSANVAYWLNLLQIKQTIFEINRMFSTPILPKSERTLVAECNECANRLCESIAWLTQPHYGFCGVLRAMGPLRYASRWYSTTLDMHKLAWCENVGQSLTNAAYVASGFAPRLDHEPEDLESSQDVPP